MRDRQRAACATRGATLRSVTVYDTTSRRRARARDAPGSNPSRWIESRDERGAPTIDEFCGPPIRLGPPDFAARDVTPAACKRDHRCAASRAPMLDEGA